MQKANGIATVEKRKLESEVEDVMMKIIKMGKIKRNSRSYQIPLFSISFRDMEDFIKVFDDTGTFSIEK